MPVDVRPSVVDKANPSRRKTNQAIEHSMAANRNKYQMGKTTFNGDIGQNRVPNKKAQNQPANKRKY